MRQRPLETHRPVVIRRAAVLLIVVISAVVFVFASNRGWSSPRRALLAVVGVIGGAAIMAGALARFRLDAFVSTRRRARRTRRPGIGAGPAGMS
jgi:hypothetical protein